MKRLLPHLLCCHFLLPASLPAQYDGDARNPSTVEVTFLQINDVYEITPLQNGRYGGLARVATIRKELLKRTPYVYTVVAGDFLSPSAIGTSVVDGKRLSGAQMVDVLNAVGVDVVTFGNHEFDITEPELEARINESSATWISANVSHVAGGRTQPFSQHHGGVDRPLPPYVVLPVPVAPGDTLKVGLFGVTIDANPQKFVRYDNYLDAARRCVTRLSPVCTAIIGLTHLSYTQDMAVAGIPGISLIMGGHEHTNMTITVGNTVITKADANVRSVYIHHFVYDPARKTTGLRSELKVVDEFVPEDSATAAVVRTWMNRANAGFRKLGLNPDSIVTTLEEPLDGREGTVREMQSPLGGVICRAMLAADPRAEAALFNGGSVRLDDILNGVLTEYDIIRTLPFGGGIFRVTLQGSLLKRLLEAGEQNAGSGGYLQLNRIRRDGNGSWQIQGKTIRDNDTCSVMTTAFLLTGKEKNMDFFTRDNPGVIAVEEPHGLAPNDIRKALVDYLRGGGR